MEVVSFATGDHEAMQNIQVRSSLITTTPCLLVVVDCTSVHPVVLSSDALLDE